MSRHAPQNHRSLPKAMGSALLTLTLGLSGCAEATPTATAAALSVPAQAGPARPLVNLPDFTPIIDRYGPTVVNISSTSSKAIPEEHNPFPPDSPFYRFFKHFGGSQGGHGASPQEKIRSLGSGFILSADGYIVTAAHVVRGAQHIVVTLTNHHAYPAKLVGLSVRYDTALLKIDAQDLPTAPLGNSDDLKVGQWLLAVGAPFGFFNTVTQGVVSATNRPLPDDEYIPFIQSDVPINPGNSGGPLFNMAGQVIGINDQIYTNSGGYMGLSFSIPINTVMQVVRDLKEHKPIEFGYLGVEVQSVTPQMAEALHLKEPVGALVASVLPDGPAAHAGLRPGDVIVTFAGKPVYNVGQLPLLVGSSKPGSTAPLGILRDGKPETLQVTVGALPKPEKTRETTSTKAAKPTALKIPRLGVDVQALDTALMDRLKIHHGVVIADVGEGAAAEAGIRPGMILQQIAQQDITSPQQLADIVRHLPADTPIPVLVRQGPSSIYVVVTLPRH
ncbi:Do family serine endopeptidase [Acidithiobacillus caldus]|uniref:Probable periplasmic serine endoprotease DegP-like n=2 Tax=Acidithiobacillus caldus TaxID=33059 RepID=A0A059ZN83_ACICK|nr:Do family serine endopeptidase [Acidithiobacillus caldus]AIA54469.1 HtrA protease/chaperone protein [Acidithiobacillus caldus ATCC 51756]MBU2728415.1 Do family serine endopeptidase [Acidithiobacillus caldus]MBU2734853.1 Do family serine endopeptidase [Acidithiobacillus caldus ATCC 51756]MBU2745780.1 Do family serine endopeptidase [Acidithiobacillus caldus]MBU2763017.1 Do family serine endopeptidase [Acidithiobacillus caldus]